MTNALILRWHLLSARNAAKAALAERARDILLIGTAALLLVVYNIASFYGSLVEAAPVIRAAWPRVAEGGLVFALLAGFLGGRACAAWAERRAAAPWLAVLPWPDAARRRAVRVACVAVGGAMMPLPALCGWGVSHAVNAAHQGLAGSAVALCFSASFAGGTFLPRRAGAAMHARRAVRVRPPAFLWRLVSGLDRPAPRWLGLWAQRDGGRALGRWWIFSLLAGGGFAAGITLAQHWIWPSIVTAALGGHMVFMAGLRSSPLGSPVVRTAPLHFGTALAGIVRGPAALSMLWFMVAALPAFAVTFGAWRGVAGGAGAMLALDTLFASAVAVNPGSRRRALVLYGSCLTMILYQGAQYGIAYGVLAAVIAACVCGYLWRQARRGFRING